jgi:hypothetical protein
MTRIGIAIAFVCLGIRALEAPAAEPHQGVLARYPTFGVAFREPEGWSEQVRAKSKTIGWWISRDSTPENPAAMIMIECGHTSARSLDEVARGLAKNFDGAVSDRPSTLGGTRALRVIAKNDGRSLRPVEGLVAIRDGLLYLVMGGVTAGHSVEDELEAIRASWTWIPIEPPYKHLEFRDEPLLLPGGVATINVPALMHTYPTEHPDRVLDLGLHNVLRNEPDFLAYAQVLSVPEGQTFDGYKDRLSELLRAQYTLKGPIEWRSSSNNPSRVVSPAIEVETTDKASGRKRTLLIRWAIVKLDERRLVSVNFTLPPDVPQGPRTYITLVDRIVDTIQPGVGTDQLRKKRRG